MEEEAGRKVVWDELRPLKTARALTGFLASTPGLTKARAAVLLGKSQAWVSQHLALLGYEGLR
jgi:predicted transcriptional regulator